VQVPELLDRLLDAPGVDGPEVRAQPCASTERRFQKASMNLSFW